jgi:GT2 family glycosyltransferase
VRSGWRVATSPLEDFAVDVAAEAPPTDEADAARAREVLSACSSGNGMTELEGRIVGHALVGRERPLASFPGNVQVERDGRYFRSLGSDPSLELGVVPAETAPATRLVLQMRAVADRELAAAQLFWTAATRPFQERSSIRIPLVADGATRVYVVDLERLLGRPLAAKALRFRFDPLDCRGEFEVRNLLLLSGMPSVTRVPTEPAGEPPRHGDPANGSERRSVDIVVPIYNARELTRRCVASVLRHAAGDVRIVLIDDESTDPGIADDLAEFARDARVVVLRNEKNAGFVRTANRGMRNAEGRDILLLNSDTEVFEGFLEGLRDAAYHDARTGIVTPFSNNATIFSLPAFGDNPIPDGHTAASMAALVAVTSRRLRPPMPTAVGFCMYVRAEVVERLGFFDEEAYGRGFGEENDYCERALEAGFEIRLCDDVFVWHKGKASFGREGLDLERTNSRVLRERHPGYEPKIARFCRTNPLAPLQAEIAFHISRLREGARGAGLFLLHASPFALAAGTAERQVLDLLRLLGLPRAVVAYPEGTDLVAAEVLQGQVGAPTMIRFALATAAPRYCMAHPELERLVGRVVERFGIRWAHLHQLLFWPIGIGRTLRDAAVPYVVSAHDYYPACPSSNLIDFDTRSRCHCSHRDPIEAPGCLIHLFAAQGLQPVDFTALRVEHRRTFAETLRGAAAVVVPSHTTRRFFLENLRLEAAKTHVIGYGVEHESGRRGAPGSLLRVAFVGDVADPLHGSRNYLELLERSKDLSVEWHVFGDVEKHGYDEALRKLELGDRLVLHAAPEGRDCRSLLRWHGIDLCVLLPEIDEPFSSALSDSFSAGVPALVLDRGSLAERVSALRGGFVVLSVEEATRKIAFLIADRAPLASCVERIGESHLDTPAEVADRYRKLYLDVGFELAPDAELRSGWLHEISERAGVPPAPLLVSMEGSAQGPARSTRARRAMGVLKPIVPKPLRESIRVAFERIEEPPVLILKLRRATLRALAVQDKALTSRTFAARTDDPQIEFRFSPFAPAAVAELRFKMRRREAGPARAQFFWAHERDAPFSEALSASIDLDGGPGEWRQYRVRLDSDNVRAAWRRGPRIARIRFDPLSAPGIFDLGSLELFPGDGGAS